MVCRWIIHLYLSEKLSIYNGTETFQVFLKSPFKKWGLFCVFGLKGVQVTAPNGRNCWNMGKGDSLPYKKKQKEKSKNRDNACSKVDPLMHRFHPEATGCSEFPFHILHKPELTQLQLKEVLSTPSSIAPPQQLNKRQILWKVIGLDILAMILFSISLFIILYLDQKWDLSEGILGPLRSDLGVFWLFRAIEFINI